MVFVFGQWILKCKYRIFNWKYVSVCVESLKFNVADVVWFSVVIGYLDVNVEILFGNR